MQIQTNTLTNNHLNHNEKSQRNKTVITDPSIANSEYMESLFKSVNHQQKEIDSIAYSLPYVRPILGKEDQKLFHFHKGEKAIRNLGEICKIINRYPDDKHLVWNRGWEAWKSWQDCGKLIRK